MDITRNFNDISQKFRKYNIQGKIVSEINFFKSSNNLAILSFIVSDDNLQKTECLAFGDNAIYLFSKYNFKQGATYQIFNTQATQNISNYRKTSHSFKLTLSSDTNIKELQIKSYVVNQKLCVQSLTDPKKKKCKRQININQKKHQLSIKNWFK